MARKGSENLKPVRSVDEARKKGSKGGRASGAARREKRTLRQLLEIALTIKRDSDVDTAEAVTAALIGRALAGDVRAYEVIRDTIGEKPTDKLDSNISGGLEIAWKS